MSEARAVGPVAPTAPTAPTVPKAQTPSTASTASSAPTPARHDAAPGPAPAAAPDDHIRAALAEYLLRLGDDRLVLGHRLSEWCGHGPILEEDIALANIALDLVGEATLFLGLAGTVEGSGRDADALAYLRDATAFRNVLIAELPRGDFAFTIVRQFLVSVAAYLHLEALERSVHAELAGIAAKAVKETRYHVRHAGEWLLTLGGGTEESQRRAQDALDALWRYTGELFMGDAVDATLRQAGMAPDLAALEAPWREQVMGVIERAGLTVPQVSYMQRGGRAGVHTEHLGHMLAEMQVLQRSHPGATW